MHPRLLERLASCFNCSVVEGHFQVVMLIETWPMISALTSLSGNLGDEHDKVMVIFVKMPWNDNILRFFDLKMFRGSIPLDPLGGFAHHESHILLYPYRQLTGPAGPTGICFLRSRIKPNEALANAEKMPIGLHTVSSPSTVGGIFKSS